MSIRTYIQNLESEEALKEVLELILDRIEATERELEYLRADMEKEA